MPNTQKIAYDIENEKLLINGKSFSYEQIKNRSTLFLVFGFSLLFVGLIATLPFLIILAIFLLVPGFAYSSYAKTLKSKINDSQLTSTSNTKSTQKNIHEELSKVHFPPIFIPSELDGCIFSKPLSEECIEIKELATHDLLYEPEIIGHDVEFSCSDSNDHVIITLSYKGISFIQWTDNYYCQLINETLNDKGRVLIKIKSIELADEYSYEISCIDLYLAIYENKTYKWEYFNVAGTSFRQKEIASLGNPNDEYSLSKKDIIDLVMIGEKIYQYDFSPQNIQLIEEPDNEYDPNAVKVVIDDVHVGYVKKEDCLHVKELIDTNMIKKVTSEIHGGKYKILIPDYDIEKDKETYDWEKSESDYFVSIGIKLK